jgi:tetratricopeptide (TPR) repeat protein
LSCGRGFAAVLLVAAAAFAQAGCSPRVPPEDYYARGVELGRAEQWDEAAAQFTLAIRLDAGNARAHLGRGIALVHLARYDEAVADLTRAMELDPLLKEAAYRYRIPAAMFAGDIDLAFADYGALVALRNLMAQHPPY